MGAKCYSSTEVNNMKRITLFLAIVITISAGTAVAKNFTLSGDYTVPIGNDKIDTSIGVGAEYKFWGVFTFSSMMYTEIIYGADNILNISQIRPIGLFSGGFGMRIPMGGFELTFGWQKFFTGTAGTDGVFAFSDSYSVGGVLNLSDFFGIGIYSRRLFNFSEEAIADSALRIETSEDTVDTIGISVRFSIF